MYLLDTHALIWYITDDQNLPSKVKQVINDPTNFCEVSIVSLWEIGIKSSLGKLKLHTDLSEIFDLIELSGISVLPMKNNHVIVNNKLEFIHRDPFDRMIIAQAQSEGLQILTKDPYFNLYEISVFWD